MKRILVVDDDSSICLLLSKYLKKNGYEVESTQSGVESIELLKKKNFHLVLCDFKLPDEDGIDLLTKFKEIRPATIVIIITGYSHVKIAVKAIKLGAYDYVTKPLYPEEILNTIKKALKDNNKESKEAEYDKSLKKFISFKDAKLKSIEEQINLVAPTDMTVIIQGETGTGKEYLARTIHSKSTRKENPFVAVDCGALPRELAGSELFGHEKGAFTGALNTKQGSFQLANSGTLFLDEIGNLPYEIQVMLLRVLQERKIRRIGGTSDIEVDLRIIVATNEDLKKSVEDGKFREDIYHRLNEFSMYIPPLRERKNELIDFASHFMHLANDELGKNIEGMTDNVKAIIIRQEWHGNLRELKNTMKRAVLLTKGNLIAEDVLPKEFLSNEQSVNKETETISVNKRDLKSASEEAEKEIIIRALEETNHNKSKTATLLNIDRKTLYNKMKMYNITSQ